MLDHHYTLCCYYILLFTTAELSSERNITIGKLSDKQSVAMEGGVLTRENQST